MKQSNKWNQAAPSGSIKQANISLSFRKTPHAETALPCPVILYSHKLSTAGSEVHRLTFNFKTPERSLRRYIMVEYDGCLKQAVGVWVNII